MIVPQSFEDGLLRTDEIEDIAAHVNGLPYTADGSLAVSLEGTVNHVSGGIPFDVNGRVCVGEGDPAWYLRGLAVTSAGRLCVAFSGDAVLHIGGLPATAAGAILANLNAAATFALDFEQDDYFGFSPAFAHTRATASSLVQQFDGSFVQMLANEWGREGGRRLRNLLNNTDTLATQGVTVEAADYWLSFTGTGSVAVSGVATDSLAGTGASDRVAKKVTMGSAGTATFTVTGSVTNAYLYKSRTGQTVADPEYVSRGVLSAPYHGWGVDGVAWLKTDEEGNDLTVEDALGPELVANGDFNDGATNWSFYDGNTLTPSAGAVASGELTVTGATAPRARQTLTGLVVGKRYRATGSVIAATSSPRLVFAAGLDLTSIYVEASPSNLQRQDSIEWVATNSTAYLGFRGNAAGVLVVDNISVREVYPVRAAGIVRRPAVTNLLLRSEEVDTTPWAVSAAGAGTNAVVTQLPDEDGVSVWRVQTDCGDTSSVANRSILRNNIAGVTVSQTYTTSIEIRAHSVADVGDEVRMVVESGGATEIAHVLTADWQRVSFTGAATATTIGLVLETRGTVTDNQTADFDVRMPQCTQTAVVTPYVPTTTTAVTADADVITLDKDAIGYSAAGGVWVVEHTPVKAISADAGEQVLLDLYTSANERARVYNPSSNLGVEVVDDSVSQWSANDADANWVAGTQQRVAVRFVADDGSLVTDGTEHLTDAGMTVPTVTSINIGGLAASKYSGTIERIAYYAEPV